MEGEAGRLAPGESWGPNGRHSRRVDRRRKLEIDAKAEPRSLIAGESLRSAGRRSRKIGRRRKSQIGWKGSRKMQQPMRVGG